MKQQKKKLLICEQKTDLDVNFDPQKFKQAIGMLLESMGLKNSTHVAITPQKVSELWQKHLLDGHNVDIAELLSEGYDDSSEDMVVLKNIALHGMCPHHLLPFKGVAHLAYIPGGKLFGFGRLTRLVDAICHRMTLQEWCATDICTALIAYGSAQGAACMIEAEHMCLHFSEKRRGDELIISTAYSGVFKEPNSLKQEFIAAINM